MQSLLRLGDFRYWGIFWIDASTHESIQQSYNQIGQVLKIDQDIDNVKRFLTNTSKAWLLVLDSMDDPDLELNRYVLVGTYGDVIVTSRNPQLRSYTTVGQLEIAQLPLAQSVELLKPTVGSPTTVWSSHDLDGIQEIVENLGYLPLAIARAGAYLRKMHCSLSDFLKTYERRRPEVLHYAPKHNGTDYYYSVYDTLEVSKRKIDAAQTAESRTAHRMLDMIGSYYRTEIPIEIFHNAEVGQLHLNGESLDGSPSDKEWSEIRDSPQLVEDSIGLLASFSLLKRDDKASISLHPLVHAWCRDRITSEKGRQSQSGTALLLLASSVHEGHESKDYRYRKSLVPHVQSLLRLENEGNLACKEIKYRPGQR